MRQLKKFKDFKIEDGVVIEYLGHDTDIVIPDGVNTIGREAFQNSDIESVIIPNSVTQIYANAFYSCHNLHTLTIGSPRESKEEITVSLGCGAFQNCNALREVDIYVNLQLLVHIYGSSAFNIGYCTDADAKLRIHEGVTKIGNGVFEGFKTLGALTIGPDVENIENIAFHSCISLREIHIPHSVTYIGEYAFYDCMSAEKILIGDPNREPNLLGIGDGAFKRLGSSSLKMVQIYNNIAYCGGSPFALDFTHRFEHNCITIAEFGADQEKTLSTAIIGDKVSVIAEGTFRGMTDLGTVIIGDRLEVIEKYLFYNCTHLSNITMGENIMSIKDRAFTECNSLTSIFLYDKLRSKDISTTAFPETLTRIFYGGSKKMWDRTEVMRNTLHLIKDELSKGSIDSFLAVGLLHSAIESIIDVEVIYNCTKEMYDELNRV